MEMNNSQMSIEFLLKTAYLLVVLPRCFPIKILDPPACNLLVEHMIILKIQMYIVKAVV